jgi:hypothetical protein
MEALQDVVSFRETGGFRGTPLPLRSIAIIDLAENREVIYGSQQFRSKILSRRDLGPLG